MFSLFVSSNNVLISRGCLIIGLLGAAPTKSEAANAIEPSNAPVAEAPLVTRARQTLNEALKTETGWIRLHAIEAWVALGDGDRMRRLCESELPSMEKNPYRIGTWRVLAATASTPREKAVWLGHIEKAFLDRNSADRLQAIESLAKLGHVISGDVLAEARALEKTLPPATALFPLWALVIAREPGALNRLVNSLTSSDVEVRRRTSAIFRWLAPTDPSIRQRLLAALETEPAHTIAAAYLLNTALMLKLNPSRTPEWRPRLEKAFSAGPANVRLETSQSLMRLYSVVDLPRIAALLDDPEGDSRIATAWTILFVSAQPGRG